MPHTLILNIYYLREKFKFTLASSSSKLGFPGGSVLKNLPADQEMWVRSLGREEPVEEEMASFYEGMFPSSKPLVSQCLMLETVP